jgi:outer membrane protein assembly factor BamB
MRAIRKADLPDRGRHRKHEARDEAPRFVRQCTDRPWSDASLTLLSRNRLGLPSRHWIALALAGLVLSQPTTLRAAEPGAQQSPLFRVQRNLASSYAQTAWPAGHRDSANSDYVPIVMSRNNRLVEHLLPGHPLFWPPLSGPDGTLYVTSGKGPGASHLHAFTSSGELLWQSAPQQSLADLDSFAIINAPVVDSRGNVYVGDRDQLWSFTQKGEVRWTTSLPPLGIESGFVTVVLSLGGLVGGVSTDGKVAFFHRNNGEIALPILDLPGGPGPDAEDTPPSSLWRNLMDPEIVPLMFNLIQGWEMEVGNTPAMDPRSGRLFITAAGATPDTGVLYGIDILDDRLEIAWQAEMGGGSGTSPAISHDGQTVYALDEAGHMVAIDAKTGARRWQTKEGGGGAASPSIGPDGRIYSPSRERLLAFAPDGSQVYAREYSSLCAEQIETPEGFWSWIFSEPVAFIDSLVTVAEREGWINLVCGYHIALLPSSSQRTQVPLPQKSLVVAIDLSTGEAIGEPLEIPETSEGFIVPTRDGNIFVSLSGAISSIFYHTLNPFLPARFEIPREPKAGLLLLEPVDRRAFAREGLGWMQRKIEAAQAALNARQPRRAAALLRSFDLQFVSTASILNRLYQEEKPEYKVRLTQLHHMSGFEMGRSQLMAALDGSKRPGRREFDVWSLQLSQLHEHLAALAR